jgi:hypothetical protein
MGFMSAPAASGDFNTFIKYDARAGRWFTKPEGGGDLYEVNNMTAIMDLENIRTGWFHFMEGAAPTKVFDPSLSQAAPKPSPDSKRGFEVMLYSDKNIGGLREFASTAGAVIESMNTLYDAWMAQKAANPGKLPVVKCKGTTAIKTAKSTNYSPQFEIVQWADRPGDMPVPERAASNDTQIGTVQTAAGTASIAAAKPQEMAEIGDGVEF